MRPTLLAVWAAGMIGIAPGGAQTAATPEPLSGWHYFKELPVPRVAASGDRNAAELLDFVLDKETLNDARPDQADLRLFDRAGREIPYVLRVRRDLAATNIFPAREFNRGTDGGIAQLSLDLGEQPQQHNQVDVETAGNNFRRVVDVQGSADGVKWSTLAAGAMIFRFLTNGRAVSQQTVNYPVSRYRYLRLRVARDPQMDRGAPEVIRVRVQQSVQLKGETVEFTGNLEGRDADRANARPASIWRVDFGGRIPMQRVFIATEGGVFSRPFRLEAVDDPASPALLTSGELTQRENAAGAPLAIDFAEHFARRLKLTVIDDRNAPLAITGVTAQSAARQVVFETAAAGPGPLRLYYGNSKALAPRYDLAARVPADPRPPPARLALGPQLVNPVYRPEPKPFSERSPWLVYAVLAAASLALAAILVSLARASARGVSAG